MVRRLGLGKNNHLTYTSLALNPRYDVLVNEILATPQLFFENYFYFAYGPCMLLIMLFSIDNIIHCYGYIDIFIQITCYQRPCRHMYFARGNHSK